MGAEDGGRDAGLRFCDTLFPRPTFCADFDGASFLDGWANADKSSNSGVTGGAKLDLDDVLYASGLGSARFEIPTLIDERARASAFLLAELPEPVGVLDFACDLRIETDLPSNWTGAVQLFALSFGTQAGYLGIFRASSGWSLMTFERVGAELVPSQVVFPATIPPLAWTPMKIHVRSGTGTDTGSITATLGDQTVSLAEPAAFHGERAQKPTVSVGVIVARGPTAGFHGNVDNVHFSISR
jgi:hypothetical protein